MSLNFNQKQVVECLSHGIAIACPGAGKTKVLEHKVKYILSLYPDARIIITTFTRASAKDIRDRIEKSIGTTAARKIIISTFHAIAIKQLKDAGIKFQIINDYQIKQYVERAVEESKLSIDVDTAIHEIEKCNSNFDYFPGADIEKLYTSYSKLLSQNKVNDFSGIFMHAVKLMLSGKLPTVPCDFLFCDEGQDIDEVQYQWCVQHINAGAKLTIVGDDDQSIYKFRRALGHEGMARVHTEFSAKIFKLDTNYRSNVEIIDFAGRLIEHNSERFAKQLTAHKGVGGQVEAWQCADAAEEAEMIVRKILASSSSRGINNTGDNLVEIGAGEWAVLARNNHNLNVVAMAFIANKIPFAGKVKNLWAEQPVCFAIGLLSSLTTAGKRDGYEAAMFFSGISQSVLKRIFEIYGDLIEEYLIFAEESELSEFDDKTIEKLMQFAKLVQTWFAALSKKRENQVIRQVFEWFANQLKDNNTLLSKNALKISLKQLKDAGKFLIGASGNLEERLNRVMFQGDKSKNVSPGVFMGTLHASKGLEFENVCIIHADDRTIPSEIYSSQEMIEEERRLFYVGMTRAKSNLCISCTSTPSIFISEAEIRIKAYYK
jgi:superfamily I DNA/RNA helicase